MSVTNKISVHSYDSGGGENSTYDTYEPRSKKEEEFLKLLKERLAQKKQREIIYRINKWSANGNSYLQTHNDRYADGNDKYRADASSYAEQMENDIKGWNSERDAISKLLNTYKEYYDEEFVSQISDILFFNRFSLNPIMEFAQKDNKYWSQFGSENDYNFVSAMQNNDFDAAQTYLQGMYKDVSNLGGEDPAIIEKRTEKLKEYQDYFTQMKEYTEFMEKYSPFVDKYANMSKEDLTAAKDALGIELGKAVNSQSSGADPLGLSKSDTQKIERELEYVNLLIDQQVRSHPAFKFIDLYNKVTGMVDDSVKKSTGIPIDSKQMVSDISEIVSDVKKLTELPEYFQGSALFEDGWQAGDVLKTAGATAADLGVNLVKGGFNAVEGLVDLGAYGAAAAVDASGDEEIADAIRRAAIQSQTDQIWGGLHGAVNPYSVLSDQSDEMAQSLAQMYTIGLTAGSAGLGKVGTSVLNSLGMGLSTMGGSMGEAYQGDADDWEALAYGAMSGAIEAGSEMIFGGLGKAVNALGFSKGISSLDDTFAKKLSDKISSQFWKNAVQFGVKAGAEGLEEVIAGLGSAVAKKLTYLSEEDLWKLVVDERLLSAFVSGAVMSGFAQSGLIPGTKQGSFIDTTRQGRDFITGLTADGQRFVDAEYAARLSEAEKNGQKLSRKDKLRTYEDVLKSITVDESVQKQFTAQNDTKRQQVTADIEKKISSEISDKQVRAKMAEALTKIAYGENVSNSDLRKISQSKKALKVLEEITGTKHKSGEVTVKELRKEISSKQDSTTRLSSENILATASAFFNMDEVAERSLMVNYAADTRNAEGGKVIAPEEYAALYNAVYIAGKKGNDISKISGEISSVMSESSIVQAYRAGQNAGAAVKSERSEQSRTAKDELLGSLEIGKLDNNKSYYTLDELGISKKDQAAWISAGIATERNIRGTTVATVNTTTLKAELKRRENSQKDLSNRTESGKINTKDKEHQNEQEQNGVHLRDGSERNRGQDPGGQVSAVEGRARQDQSRKETRSRPRDSKAASLAYGEEVDAKLLGIKGGVEAGKVHRVAEGSEIASMKKARELADSCGLKVTFFVGGNLRVAQNGKIASVRGYIQGDEIFIRVDHPKYTADQLTRHEICHYMIDRGEIDVSAVRELINERFDKEGRELIAAAYEEAYRGSGLSPEEIWVEIICDSYGDMNVFDSVEALGDINAEFLSALKEEILNNRKESRGPPTQSAIHANFSIELEPVSGEKFVVIEKDSISKLMNCSGDSLPAKVRSFMKQQYRGMVLPLGTTDKAYMRREAEGEYTNPAKLVNDEDYKGKLNAASELRNLLKTSKFVRHDIDNGRHPDATRGWNYYKINYVVPISDSEIRAYSGEIQIKLIDRGDCFYDITKIKDITDGSAGQAFIKAAGSVYDVSNNSISQKSHLSTDSSKKIFENEGKASQDLDFFDFLEESEGVTDVAEVEARELSNREMLADMLERDDMSPSQKGFLTKYKNKIAQIEANEQKISDMTAELDDLKKSGKGKSAKAATLENQIRTLEKQNAASESIILNLEATKPIKRLLERERKAAYAEGLLAGQMAQGKDDAPKLRRAEEKNEALQRRADETLADYKKRIEERENQLKLEARERMAVQREKAREALEKQAKRYQESRAASIEGRHKTAVKNKIRNVVAELDKLLRHGNKKSNVKLGLQDAVALSLEAFDINEEKVARYERDMATLDEKIAAATDPIEIEALTALRDKKKRNSEVLADKLLAMKKAYEDIHNNAGDENYPAYYRAEAKVIQDRISDVLEKVGNVPISEMSLDQLDAVYDMYRMVLTTVRDANKAFIDGKLEDLAENAADMTAELQKIKKLPEERLRAGDNARGFVWNELTPYYAFKRIGSETLMRYYDELVRGQDVYARDLDEAKRFAEKVREKYKADKWNRNKIVTFKDKDGRTFRLNLGHMMSIYAYSKREQAFDHMEKGGFFFNNKETFRTKGGVLEFISSNESGYKVDAAVFAKIKAALTPAQIAYVDEMQAYLTEMGAKGNEVTRIMWGIDIFKENVYFPLKSKEDFIYQANTPAETSSLKNDGMTKETKPHASNPIVLESFDDVWANHVNKMSTYHGFVIPIDNLNKLINYGSWIDGDKKITSGMSDAERYEALKDRKLSLSAKANKNALIDVQEKIGVSDNDIEYSKYGDRVRLFKKLGNEFSVFHKYSNDDVKIEFSFSKENMRESVSKQGRNFVQMAKMLTCLNDVVDNAVGIEVHNRNEHGYKADNTLENVYVLTSAFVDGENVVPVKLEIKKFSDKENTLYVAIALESIKIDGIVKQEVATNGVARQYSPPSDVSISQIFEKINTSDQSFLKYVPDGFLTEEQIEAKKQALAKDGVTYSPSSKSDLTGIEMGSHSISTMLEARYSNAVNDYLTTFIKDLNGAKAQNGGLLGFLSNGLTKFKKTAVAASLSVVVQQPTAILRATSEIDARYFANLPKVESLNKKWDKIQKYAPIAIIKDIGGFDAGSGRQITEWLNADTRQGARKVMNKIDDVTMYGAALGDRVGWGAIWTAVEREVRAKQGLTYGTEEYFQACGKRFTEVIVKTQVYDSTLSRSGFMRGKDGLLKMATAFMGEPTLSINMLADTFLQAKRGTIKKSRAVRTVAAVYSATVAASIIKSIIYALRDDDEDESYAEKYLQALGGTILNDVNPLSMLPVFRDVVSILDGWEVERTDMAIVQDLYNAITALNSENKTTWRKIEDLAGALGALAGVPAKNLLRTAREMYNAINDTFDGIEGGDLGGAFVEGITGKEKSKSQTLYEALIEGDPERIYAIKNDYKTAEAYQTAVRKALREHDPRIQLAAEALMNGDLLTRNTILYDIVSEGVFDESTVLKAIQAEYDKMKTDANASDDVGSDTPWYDLEDDDTPVEGSIYSTSDITTAFEYCSDELALEIIAELTELKVAEKIAKAKAAADSKGEKFDEKAARAEAESSVRSTLRSTMTKYYKSLYQAAYKKGNQKEMKRIKDILNVSGLYVYKTDRTVDDVLEEWLEEE